MVKKPESPRPTRWTIYEIAAKQTSLGEVEAAGEAEAIEKAAKEFRQHTTKLIAVRRDRRPAFNFLRERSAGVILTFPSRRRGPFRPSGRLFASAFLIWTGVEEITMIDASSFDSLPPGGCDSDPDDLDSLIASLDHLALCCCEPRADKGSQHPSFEAMSENEKVLAGAIRTVD